MHVCVYICTIYSLYISLDISYIIIVNVRYSWINLSRNISSSALSVMGHYYENRLYSTSIL